MKTPINSDGTYYQTANISGNGFAAQLAGTDPDNLKVGILYAQGPFDRKEYHYALNELAALGATTAIVDVERVQGSGKFSPVYMKPRDEVPGISHIYVSGVRPEDFKHAHSYRASMALRASPGIMEDLEHAVQKAITQL